jgi:UDP-glucose 4-epimerase
VSSKAAVVTGGVGFIGSQLAEELLKRRYKVIILDDLSTGKLENITHILNSTKPTNFTTQQTEFVRGSIADLPLVKNVFQGVDYVFHQAAIPSVPRSIENPQATHDANITGTLNVLLAAKDNGVKKVIYASSSAVYGDTPTLPKTEDMFPNPQSPYAVTKLAGEYYCRVFHQVYGLPTVCLRYFNVYGPRQDPRSQYAAVIPAFIQNVLDGRPPIIFGDGKQTRDFTFVRDVVDANILAAESDATGVYNIGRGERVSINRLAKLVIKLVGNKVAPVHREPRPGDVKHSLADISRARQFGYNPQYDLEEGLRETIRVMRER